MQIQHNGKLSGLADTLRRREDRTRCPLQWAHSVRAENIRAHRVAAQVSTHMCVHVCGIENQKVRLSVAVKIVYTHTHTYL